MLVLRILIMEVYLVSAQGCDEWWYGSPCQSYDITRATASIANALPAVHLDGDRRSRQSFPADGVEPRRLQRTADSGRVNTRLVCPECGSWVCGTPRDGVVRVRAGTLANTSWLRPTRHAWTRYNRRFFGANSSPSCEANKGLKLVTGIWRDRDIAAGWRYLQTPCASLPTRSPSHRASRAVSRGSRPSKAARGERPTLRWRKPDSNFSSLSGSVPLRAGGAVLGNHMARPRGVSPSRDQ
jgi:hypothetical protein